MKMLKLMKRNFTSFTDYEDLLEQAKHFACFFLKAQRPTGKKLYRGKCLSRGGIKFRLCGRWLLFASETAFYLFQNLLESQISSYIILLHSLLHILEEHSGRKSLT